jgi:hypothetical protein
MTKEAGLHGFTLPLKQHFPSPVIKVAVSRQGKPKHAAAIPVGNQPPISTLMHNIGAPSAKRSL